MPLHADTCCEYVFVCRSLVAFSISETVSVYICGTNVDSLWNIPVEMIWYQCQALALQAFGDDGDDGDNGSTCDDGTVRIHVVGLTSRAHERRSKKTLGLAWLFV